MAVNKLNHGGTSEWKTSSQHVLSINIMVENPNDNAHR